MAFDRIHHSAPPRAVPLFLSFRSEHPSRKHRCEFHFASPFVTYLLPCRDSRGVNTLVFFGNRGRCAADLTSRGPQISWFSAARNTLRECAFPRPPRRLVSMTTQAQPHLRCWSLSLVSLPLCSCSVLGRMPTAPGHSSSLQVSLLHRWPSYR
jgi:hypothetical protein